MNRGAQEPSVALRMLVIGTLTMGSGLLVGCETSPITNGPQPAVAHSPTVRPQPLFSAAERVNFVWDAESVKVDNPNMPIEEIRVAVFDDNGFLVPGCDTNWISRDPRKAEQDLPCNLVNPGRFRVDVDYKFRNLDVPATVSSYVERVQVWEVLFVKPQTSDGKKVAYLVEENVIFSWTARSGQQPTKVWFAVFGEDGKAVAGCGHADWADWVTQLDRPCRLAPGRYRADLSYKFSASDSAPGDTVGRYFERVR